ncbi:hypothetical protein EYC84_011961 [Monilinia fructicola]|uniref:Uncharacterized protein n=1 Tax=Monilinia fructicola TaxID=38448 RepID=A0A5M9J472_MONFR|nr:hypothetical protein EYC84_011961 [Monilinia fructicola]
MMVYEDRHAHAHPQVQTSRTPVRSPLQNGISLHPRPDRPLRGVHPAPAQIPPPEPAPPHPRLPHRPPHPPDLARPLRKPPAALLPTRTVSLDPAALFAKIVGAARGRGGYCLEGSTFFNHVLRALGFQVYAAGARIRRRSEEDGVPRGDYIGWFHMVNIVTLPDGHKYMVDVAFGGDGATRPLALVPGRAVRNLGLQEVRLVREAIPQLVDRSQLQWVYQYRNGAAGDWNAYYAFAEVEFLHADLEIVNFFVSGRVGGGNFQTENVFVVAFLSGRGEGEGEEGEGEVKIIGKRMLVNGVLKENLGGKTRVVRVCQGEERESEGLEGGIWDSTDGGGDQGDQGEQCRVEGGRRWACGGVEGVEKETKIA